MNPIGDKQEEGTVSPYGDLGLRMILKKEEMRGRLGQR